MAHQSCTDAVLLFRLEKASSALVLALSSVSVADALAATTVVLVL